ncbi:hypothetical protein [uncultured Clostridium sp.]|uniref:hypothetical protein n=1 Tax=uncultured Clostridium sp. TaxID=59620 RepID=UPI0026085A98|nr:hypothetical protein [uncultured Clostridium sp.]
MMKRYQVTELLQLAVKVFPLLNNCNITIKETNEFSCIVKDNNTYIITYTNDISFKHDYYFKNICNYLQDKFKFNDSVKMVREFELIFSFLHEIGHIVNINKINNESVYYSDFKNAVYNSHQQAFKAYREIPTESLADASAIEIMIKYNTEIYSMFNNMSIEEAKTEINFWNEF